VLDDLTREDNVKVYLRELRSHPFYIPVNHMTESHFGEYTDSFLRDVQTP
jgi:hypothetical protein